MKSLFLSLAVLALATGLSISAPGDLVIEPELSADVLTVSAGAGGEQVLSIDAGEGYGGYRYLVVGSSSGVFPGTVMDGLRVPLNYDSYTQMMLQGLERPGYKRCRGHLDAAGQAQASLVMPAGQAPSLIGTVYYHAAVIVDPKNGHLVDATNAVEVLMLP